MSNLNSKNSILSIDWHLPSTQQQYENNLFSTEKWLDFVKLTQRKDIGFFRLPQDHTPLNAVNVLAKRFSDRDTFFHVGIGGSALGPECLIEALNTDLKRQFLFLNNIDPDHTAGLIKKIHNPKKTVFYIVSKSGTTAETMAAFAILTEWLKVQHHISSDQWKDYFVFCTDPEKGDLRKIAREYNIACLEVPPSVGGRFSVLTQVGLFPAAWCGLDISSLINGALKMSQEILAEGNKGKLATIASIILGLYRQSAIDQTVIMPYSSRLKNFSAWFVQLWAESLGKKLDINGKIIHTGLTPIASYGATDQHSQVQLFMEGPINKVTLFIEVEKFTTDFPMHGTGLTYESLKTLAPYKLSDLLKAELEGTLQAMREAQRPWIRIKIERCQEESLGALFLFFESLTALVGQRLGIDPFDQPGVEAGKKYAYQWLSQARR
jgi:glucose-6-phosphate isomerase